MKVIARSITSILNLEDSYDIKKSFGAGEFYIELYFDVNNNAFFIRCFVTDGWGPLEALGDIERQKNTKNKQNYETQNINDYFLNLLLEINITLQHSTVL